MWSKRSYLIHPLTEITSHKVKFKWSELEQQAFDAIKHAVYQENLLAYTDLIQVLISIRMTATTS